MVAGAPLLPLATDKGIMNDADRFEGDSDAASTVFFANWVFRDRQRICAGARGCAWVNVCY